MVAHDAFSRRANLGRVGCRKSRENTLIVDCTCCVSESCALSRRSFTFLIVAADRTSLSRRGTKNKSRSHTNYAIIVLVNCRFYVKSFSPRNGRVNYFADR